MNYTISDLKKSLNGGSRKNKYLLELATPVIGFNESKLNMLCQSASLPERAINISTIWHKGRKYNIRSETEYPGSITFTFIDDNKMTLRKGFDKWLNLVDNSKPISGGLFGGTSYESGAGQIASLTNSAVNLAEEVSSFISDPLGSATDYVSGLIDPNNKLSVASYQTDINVWQLSSDLSKVYGYKMQNAFISNISSVDYSDSELDSLVEFNVTFTYSEFLPLEDQSNSAKLLDAILGDELSNAVDNVESLFD